MTTLQHPILVGVIGAPQGIRGEVRVKPFTEDPAALAEYGVVYDAKGIRYEVLSARPNGNVVVLRLMGVNDRNQAETLRGVELFVDRSSLPDDELEEDEFFHADLEGLEAFDADGKSWGTVTAVFDFGGGDLLELRQPGGKSVVIPFSLAAVPEIDIKAGRLLVDPDAAGLLDDGSEAQANEQPAPAAKSGKRKPKQKPKSGGDGAA